MNDEYLCSYKQASCKVLHHYHYRITFTLEISLIRWNELVSLGEFYSIKTFSMIKLSSSVSFISSAKCRLWAMNHDVNSKYVSVTMMRVAVWDIANR
jgi:hypothetical protein